MTETQLKIAVFIDFDNIEIGVKSTLGSQFDVGVVLEGLKERGEVVSKTAYGDWKRAGDHSRLLSQHAIKMVQRNLTPGGDKNGADINLALDALEMAFTHSHINAFVIVGGDSDFISLVEKLKQYDKKVFVVGGRAFTSGILQRNCHEFIAYENLTGASASRRPAERGRSTGQTPTAQALPIAQAFPLVRRALKLLADREVSPQIGLLKSTLVQLDSTFSERNYGSSSFRDFAEKLAAADLVNLKSTGRNLQVELKDADHASADAGSGDAPVDITSARRETAEASALDDSETLTVTAEVIRPAGDGIQQVRELLNGLKTTPRWPMYIRQVKQLFRGLDRTFDERRFGYGSLVDLLRGGQRENLFRLERDRQGVLRVFPGSAFPQPGVTMPELSDDQQDRDTGEAAMANEPVIEAETSMEPVEIEASMVDVVDAPAEEVDVPARSRRGRGRSAVRPPRKAPRPRTPRARAAKE